MRTELGSTVEAIDPWDGTEADHRDDATAWIDSGAPLLRVARPATPPKHLVGYSLVVDPTAGAALLIHHRLSGLWLPAGGHVEEGETPAEAARREVGEELGIDGTFLEPWNGVPFFVTVTPTVGTQLRHVDVSLWYVFTESTSTVIRVDEREAFEARWWPYDRIGNSAGDRFDPHLPRAIAKLVGSQAGAA